jgi:ribose/xylose/arabinose/galactoside ABC-type transport system permease subunit
MFLLLFLTTDRFRSMDNFLSILQEASFIGIAGLGMTFCIITGGLDLSSGSMIALLAVINMLLLNATNSFLVIFIVLILGALLGAFNGILVSKVKIPAFIATLATFYIFRALAYIITGGDPVSYSAAWFIWIGNGKIFGIPFSFILMIVLAFFAHLILRRTWIGRTVVAIGNSPEASRISGLNNTLATIFAFMMVGITVAISSILISSRLWSANPRMMDGYEFKVITAVVLGGTALEGGKGSMFNTVVAAIFYCGISNAMTLYHVDSYVISIVTGIILLLAFSLNPIMQIIGARKNKADAKKSKSGDAK